MWRNISNYISNCYFNDVYYNRHVNTFTNIVLTLIVLFVYALIISQIDRGVSVDEGYYLLSYLKDISGPTSISRSHEIVKAFFSFLPEDSVLYLRYIRFFLTIICLSLFAVSSYTLLQKKYEIQIARYTYFLFVYLVGALSFCFGSPTLYYDSIQMCIYLLVFSLLFFQYLSSFLVRLILQFIIGVLLLFGLFNYLPSGILLFFYVLIFSIFNDNLKREKTVEIVAFFVGIFLGCMLYHSFIEDIYATLNIIFDSYLNAQNTISGHDNNSLIAGVVSYFLNTVGFFILFTSIWLLFFTLISKIRKKSYQYFICFVLILIAFVLFIYRPAFKYLQSTVLLIPIAFLLAYKLSQIILNRRIKKVDIKNIVFICILLTIPLSGFFGTNQAINAKMFFLMPFWLLAFFLIYAACEFSKSYKFAIGIISTILVVATYTHLSYFTRTHFLYTPTSSKYIIRNAHRCKNIKVSQWQRDYYENAITQLYNNGYEPSEFILTFYDNFLTVYMAGADNLYDMTYQVETFVTDRNRNLDTTVDYILIIQEQEKLLTDYLQNTNWGFPAAYERINLGRSAQNLPENRYDSILFVKEK